MGRLSGGASLVSSPGLELARPLISSDVLADGFSKMVRDLRYAETSNRGYLVATLTPAVARADWIAISAVFSHSYAVIAARSLRALPGAGNLEVLPV